MEPSQHTLTYISSGSFGDIYALDGTPYVLKEHVLSDDERKNGKTPFCVDWRHEFDIHTTLYNKCNKQLGLWDASIVKPYKFGLLQRGVGNAIISYNATSQQATACYYTMERILPYNTNRPFCARTLQLILKSLSSLKYEASIPPYLYLADVSNENGHHISLPMCAGSTKVSFSFREGYDYCYATGAALGMLDSMYASYFYIVSCGYIPRDIEFVLNAHCPENAFISILDFNQVKSWSQRQAHSLDPSAYNLERDIAEVYIDLCSLRAPNTENPHYDTQAEPPTPQWKFLCSPLTAPQAFCALTNKYSQNDGMIHQYNYARVIHTILSYTITNHLDQINYDHQYLYLLRPTCISRVGTQERLPSGGLSLGVFTSRDFLEYLSSLSHYSPPNTILRADNDTIQYHYYVDTNKRHPELEVGTMYLMYDLAYQNHIIGMCIRTLESRGVDVGSYAQVLTGLVQRPFPEILEFLVEEIQRVSYKVDDMENDDTGFPSLFGGRCSDQTKSPLLVRLGTMKTRRLKKNNQRWPRKYYAGLTAKQAAVRRKEILKYGALPSSNRRAYVGFKTDRGVKTKTSSYTEQFRRVFPDAKSLTQKAKATGVPERFLKVSYDRGLAAWRTGHRPGATGQQWGYARVHSLLMCGKTHYGPDSDVVHDAKEASSSARSWFKRCKTVTV
jgi:hypothetical protein